MEALACVSLVSVRSGMSTIIAGLGTLRRISVSCSGVTDVGNTMSASFGVARQPAHRVLEIAAHPHRVRARYDHEVRILARLDRSVDPRHRLLERPQPLRHIGVLTEGMVFDVDRGGARLLERLHGAPDVRSVVEP